MCNEHPKPGRVEGSKQGIPYLLITLTINAAALFMAIWWLELHLRRVIVSHVEARVRLANKTKP